MEYQSPTRIRRGYFYPFRRAQAAQLWRHLMIATWYYCTHRCTCRLKTFICCLYICIKCQHPEQALKGFYGAWYSLRFAGLYGWSKTKEFLRIMWSQHLIYIKRSKDWFCFWAINCKEWADLFVVYIKNEWVNCIRDTPYYVAFGQWLCFLAIPYPIF